MALRTAALLAVLAIASADLLFKSNFDAIPLRGKGKIKRHLDSEDGHWKTEITNCPGGRGNINSMYKNCLYQELNYCKYNEEKDKKCMRNELGLPMNQRNIFDFGKDLWVGQSIYIPKDYKKDNLKTIHFQLHANGGQDFAPGGPMMALQDIDGQWALRISGSSDCDAYSCNFETFYVQFLAPVVPGEWYDFVYSTKLTKSWNDPGYVNLWMNGELIFRDDNIMTAYKEEIGPHMKFGLYKHEWASDRFSGKGHNLVEKVSTVKSALIVKTGKNEYHHVDTSPGGRKSCTSLEECCMTCSDGKTNPLFNRYRCNKYCDKSTDPASNKYCPSDNKHKECSGADCCEGCVNGKHNPLYNPKQCTKQCRESEMSGSSKLAKYCLPTNANACDNNPCDKSTGAKCVPDSYRGLTYRCECTKKGYIQWKNFPSKCYNPEIQRAYQRLEAKVLGEYQDYQANIAGLKWPEDKKIINKSENKMKSKMRERLQEYQEVDDNNDYTVGDLIRIAEDLADYKA